MATEVVKTEVVQNFERLDHDSINEYWNGSQQKSKELFKEILELYKTSTEKEDIDFLNSHFGMQYNQLSGEYTGSSFYLEFNFLLSPKKGLIIPTASVGSIYYF